MVDSTNDQNGPMARALSEARAAADRGEVPVGAVVVDSRDGRILGADGNRTEELSDPSGHAEILVLRKVCAAAGSPRIPDCDLYVTLEPCAMCAAAISAARVRLLVFGAYDPKSGGVEHGAKVFEHKTCHHAPQVVGGVREREAADQLRAFFLARRS